MLVFIRFSRRISNQTGYVWLHRNLCCWSCSWTGRSRRFWPRGLVILVGFLLFIFGIWRCLHISGVNSLCQRPHQTSGSGREWSINGLYATGAFTTETRTLDVKNRFPLARSASKYAKGCSRTWFFQSHSLTQNLVEFPLLDCLNYSTQFSRHKQIHLLLRSDSILITGKHLTLFRWEIITNRTDCTTNNTRVLPTPLSRHCAHFS